MVTVTAAIVLAENGYTTDDFSAVNIEYMMDNVIDTINLMAGTSIAALTGTAGSKTATLTRAENPVFQMLMSMVLRENKKTSLSNSSSTSGSESASSSVSIGALSSSESSSVGTAISATAALNNEANSIYVKMFYDACRALRMATLDPPIYLSNDPVPT